MLVDGYNRKINYLRISVTQRCNFRCRYCMPNTPFSWTPKENLLSFEELFLFVKAAIDEGINKIRITGGEPLIRKDIDKFIEMIASYDNSVDLALTTNGYFLQNYAALLKEKGLKRVNISLDTLVAQKAEFITQKQGFYKVLDGIDSAIKSGLKVKLNTVALKGFNDDELCYLLNFARDKNVMIRFIEYMENRHANNGLLGLKEDEILKILSQQTKITKIESEKNSPSSLYQTEDGYKFGIINPHNHSFCSSCNRIRLTAEGNLIPCLYFDEAMSIKEALRNKDINSALDILRAVIRQKPEQNRWCIDEKSQISKRAFYQTGG